VPTGRVIETTPTNLLKVYKEIMRYYKEYEEKKGPEKRESNEMERPKKKDLEKKEMQLFTLFPVKNTFKMSNILIDKTAMIEGCISQQGHLLRWTLSL
jgi:hypothetical protein